MRSTWKGAITFGLVSIPVQLFPATEEHGITLHQVHAPDGGRVRLKRFCELEEREIPYREIAKAYESPDGRQAVLTDEDMSELPLPSKKIIDVLAFVDAADIDPLMLSKAYYLQTATPTAAKPYVLLREALVETGKAAVTKITLRTRESLALLRVHDDLLILQTMLWPDEVREPEGLAPRGDIDVRPQELNMATSLMDTLSEGFDLQSVHDDYQQALDSLVAARLEGAEAPSGEEAVPAAPDNVVDLMAALSASVKAANRNRGREETAGADEPDAAGEGDEADEADRAEGDEGRGKPAKKTAGKKPPGPKAAGAKGAGAKAAGARSAGTKTAGAKGTSAKTAKGGKTAAKPDRTGDAPRTASKSAGKGTRGGTGKSADTDRDSGTAAAKRPRKRASA